jgi:hypothetical protein
MTKEKIKAKPPISLRELAFISHVADLIREILIWKEQHPEEFAAILAKIKSRSN